MRIRIFIFAASLVTVAFATRAWTELEFENFYREYRPEVLPQQLELLQGPRRFNYLERFKMVCDFTARWQVTDSTSPDYGGIIEAEHMPTVIETDNTQEAIWIWSRWYELTGRDDYRENIRRAWIYVLNHPAYWEHSGNPQHTWYAVWNCGLAMMVEPQYRRAYQDSSFRSYADSCAGFYLRNPLPAGGYRDNYVTAQSSGMAYEYALQRNLAVLRDTALARGRRIKSWIESDAANALGRGDWAMSGGTAFWGVCRTVGREDTVLGKQWVEKYADSLPGFYPTGIWNCSHNIWLANAYRAAAELGHNRQWWLMHQYLLDTLLQKDTDRDGGIPATWTDPPTQDQTWVSTYLVFMGMDVYVTPTYGHDICALEFVSPDPKKVYIAGDTIRILPAVANVGLSPETFPFTVRTSGYTHTKHYTNFPFVAIDTAYDFPSHLANLPGIYEFEAIAQATPDLNRANDTSRVRIKVYGRFSVSGILADSVTGLPITARITARIQGNPTILDSTVTDSLGRFQLRVLDTLITLTQEQSFPYSTRHWNLFVSGDTSLTLFTRPAHILVVNNDTLEQYDAYYTRTLDTLGYTNYIWHRRTQGLPPYARCPELRARTLIWFSGNTTIGTIPPADRDSLTALSARGINLLLTGQNIAQELAGTSFLESLVGCRFDSSGWRQFSVYGNRQDEIGRTIHATSTAGGDGAGNQNSRDVVSPLGNAARLLVYDTITNAGAGIRKELPGSGARIILLGFGFEAVNRPNARPDFLTRPAFLSRLLAWLCSGVAISEPHTPLPARPADAILAWPNPFRLVCNINAPPDAAVEVLDAAGRRVALLEPGTAVWRPDKETSSGLYFLHSRHSPHNRLCRVTYLR